jgi:hypothetical protein
LVLDVLEDRAPVARTDIDEFRITFDAAGDLEGALVDAKTSLTSALTVAALTGFEIAGVTAVAHDDFADRVRQGDEPRYLSVTETAKVLGVSKQRVSQMVRERSGLKPDCYVGGAPGFKEATVLRSLGRRRTHRLP